MAEVDLGTQAREFMASDLGRHLVGCLQQECVECMEALAKVASWRRHRIQELQNRLWRAQFMLSWLRDLLAAGKSAESVLNEAEHER